MARYPVTACSLLIKYGGLDAAALGRTAAVVRHRRHIRNTGDLQTDAIQRAHRRLAARAWSLDANFDVLHAAFLRGAAGVFGGNLRCERRALARTLETGGARRGPRQRVTLTI